MLNLEDVTINNSFASSDLWCSPNDDDCVPDYSSTPYCSPDDNDYCNPDY